MTGFDEQETAELLGSLPETRGSQTAYAPLAEHTWFRAGGPAEVLFRPADAEDLSHFLSHCPASVPVTVLGTASNVLIRDGGVKGVVIKLGPGFSRIALTEGGLVAGAGALDFNVAQTAQKAGVAGFEFLVGIPGTVGGGLRMNAGAHGGEFKDIVITVQAVDRSGALHTIPNEKMDFAYRHSGAPEDWIFTEAAFAGTTDTPDAIRQRMEDIQRKRAESQPIREKTGGSTFANPTNDPAGRKAWQLIDAAGCRGLRIGQAMISEKHCNFLINLGGATAADIEAVGEEVRRRVKETTGIELHWEIRRLGLPPREAPHG